MTFEASAIATSACTDQRSSVALWTAQRSRNWKIWQMSESGKGKIEQQLLTPHIPKVMTWLTETAEKEALLHPLPLCLCLSTHRVMNHPWGTPLRTLRRWDSLEKRWWTKDQLINSSLRQKCLLFCFNIISVWWGFCKRRLFLKNSSHSR